MEEQYQYLAGLTMFLSAVSGSLTGGGIVFAIFGFSDALDKHRSALSKFVGSIFIFVGIVFGITAELIRPW